METVEMSPAVLFLFQRVVEYVRVLAAFDDDLHLAADAGEFARPAVRHDRDVPILRSAPLHESAVQQNEASAAAIQLAGNLLDRHVAG